MPRPERREPASDRADRPLLRWLEERTGWPSLLRDAVRERIPGGARASYVFGSAVLLLLLAQLVSGLSLALSYSPSVAAAWASVARLQLAPLGRTLRALHAHGATFTLALLGLHLLQTSLAGAYRRPREVTWWLGLLLLFVVLAFALTGSLLPWDERGYWATRVTAGIASTWPFGGTLSRLLVGGAELGNLSLTRFYTLHVALLPLLLLALAFGHVHLVRRHGITPPARLTPTQLYEREETFWPRQALYDAAFALLLLAALLLLSLRVPAPLGAPADPAGAASARPEWYFRPLYELVTVLGGGGEVFATVVVPLCAAAFLFALPLLDRTGRRRVPVLALLLGGGLVAALLSLQSYRRDARSKSFQRERLASARRAQRALTLAVGGVPPEGGLALLHDQPDVRGEQLFSRRCLECHRLDGEGGDKAPALDGYLGRAWLLGVLTRPEAPEYFGHTKVRGMEGFTSLGPERLDQLVGLLSSLREARGGPETFSPAWDAGLRVFDQAGCAECHELKPGVPGLAPTLARYGSAEWLRALVRDPGHALYYDKDNSMPAFGKTLTAREIDDLVAFLLTLAGPQPVAAAR